MKTNGGKETLVSLKAEVERLKAEVERLTTSMWGPLKRLNDEWQEIHKEHGRARMELANEREEAQIALAESEKAPTPLVGALENVCEMKLSEEVRKMVQAEEVRFQGAWPGSRSTHAVAVENVRARLIEAVEEADGGPYQQEYATLGTATARLAVFNALYGGGQ